MPSIVFPDLVLKQYRNGALTALQIALLLLLLVEANESGEWNGDLAGLAERACVPMHVLGNCLERLVAVKLVQRTTCKKRILLSHHFCPTVRQLHNLKPFSGDEK